MTCEILVPQPGIKPGASAGKCRVLTSGLPGNFPTKIFVDKISRDLNKVEFVLLLEKDGLI